MSIQLVPQHYNHICDRCGELCQSNGKERIPSWCTLQLYAHIGSEPVTRTTTLCTDCKDIFIDGVLDPFIEDYIKYEGNES